MADPDLINTSASRMTYTKSKLATLPLEIKHEIFSHLLLGFNIKTANTSRQSTVYRWQKGILTTNHELGAEAKDYMLNQNRFIIITLPQRPLFAQMMEFSRIPIVTKDWGVLQRFAAETMRVTVLAYDPWEWRRSSLAQNVHVHQRKYLILAEELPVLEHHLRLWFQTLPQDHVYLTPLEDDMNAGQSGVTPLVLREIEIVSLDIEFPFPMSVRNDLTVAERIPIQRRFLGFFDGLVSGRQSLRVFGQSRVPLELEYANGMSRRSIWGPAVGWRLLESINTIKVQYESLLANSNHDDKWPVLEDYCNLLFVFLDNNLLRGLAKGNDPNPLALRMLETAPSTERWLGPVLVEIFDAVMTIASTFVTTGLGDKSDSFMNMLDLGLHLCNICESRLEDGDTIPGSGVELMHLYCALSSCCVDADFDLLRISYEHAASMLGRLTPQSPWYTQAVADLVVIRSFVDSRVSHLTPLSSLQNPY